MKDKSQHVVPNQRGTWSVRKSGAERASKVFENKQEAINYAKELAKKNCSGLYVHAKDGTIKSKNSYGYDKCPPKGGTEKPGTRHTVTPKSKK